MAENTHHKHSPSMLDKLAACPHYTRGGGNEYAEFGTLVHAAAANQIITDGLTDDQKAMVDYWHEVNGNTHFPESSRERRLSLVDDDFNVITEGTADLCHAYPDAGFVMLADLKCGEPHDYFWQMSAYAAAAMQATGMPVCHVSIVYARLRKIEQMEIPAEKIPEIIAGIKGIIAAAECGTGAYGKGEQCQWCGNQLTCPALVETAAEIGKASTPDWTPAVWQAQSVTDPDQVAKMLTLAKIVKKWAGEVERHAMQMALTGAELPGYSLTEKQGRAKVVNAQAAFERSGLAASQFLTAVDVRLPALAAAVAAHEGTSTYKARKKLDSLLADVIERGEPSKTLKAVRGGETNNDESEE